MSTPLHCPVTPPGQAPEPLRVSSGPRARTVEPRLGESSPFEVSGVLPLHGGGGDGVGREAAGAVSGNGGQSPPTPKAVTVLRPARRGCGGTAVTTVRPPAPPTAPPTAPRPQNTAATPSAQRRLCRPRCKAHARAATRKLTRGAGPGTSRTRPRAERGGLCGDSGVSAGRDAAWCARSAPLRGADGMTFVQS